VIWLGWLTAGVVLLLCLGTILAGLEIVRVRGNAKSLRLNHIEIVGFIALILGAGLLCSATVMFALWLPGRGSGPIGVTVLIGLPLSLLGTLLIRNAPNRLGRRQG
jgi:hypothetical protein